MQVEITRKNLRAATQKIKQYAPEVSTQKAYEALSVGLGYPNWDTLSAQLEKSDATKRRHAQSTPASSQTFIAYFEVSSTDEFASPCDWLRMPVDQELLKSISRAQEALKEFQGATLRHDVGSSMYWHDKSTESGDWACGLNTRHDKLVVGELTFGFNATPKHQDYEIFTRRIHVESFVTAINKRVDVDGIRWVGNVMLVCPTGDYSGFRASLEDCGELTAQEE